MSFEELLTRLLAAVLAGGTIGLERQIHGRPAGLRTHVLVCAGACIAVTAGMLAARLYPGLGMDAGRIAAGVITGVGFLGAGTIVHYREGVGGLTTAACIWFVAMTGMLAGYGFFLFAAMATILALAVLLLLDFLEDRLPSASYWRLRVRFSDVDYPASESSCREVIRKHGVILKSSTVSLGDRTSELSFVLKTRHRERYTGLIDDIRDLEGVSSIRWAHRTEAP